jgi:hypothetical protein
MHKKVLKELISDPVMIQELDIMRRRIITLGQRSVKPYTYKAWSAKVHMELEELIDMFVEKIEKVKSNEKTY